MEESLEEEFMKKFKESFQENLEEYKAKKLYKIFEYQEARKKISEIKKEYPNVEKVLEERAKIDLNKDEVEKIIEIIDIEEDLIVIAEEMICKLGFKIACKLLVNN